MEEQQLSILDRFNRWLKESVMVKLACITILVLLLLIPETWVQSIMYDRQFYANEAVDEVSGKWSGTQQVTGPVLVLPYIQTVKITTKLPNKEEKVEEESTVNKAYFLAQNLDIKGTLEPQTLHRGIFDVIVYHSKIHMQGSFSAPDLQKLGIKPQDVIWEDARLVVELSDLRGIGETPLLTLNGKRYPCEPLNGASGLSESKRSIAASIRLSPSDSVNHFAMDLSLKGSGSLQFFATGKSTEVNLSGNWGNPSFDGYYLPESRTVEPDHFSAGWKVLDFNRPFPQEWVGELPAINETAFGVSLIMPVDQYQKSIRTAKYGVLVILLTFVSLFLIELICKLKIHPFQYTLIGAALIVYYILMLSVSEHLGFNLAYVLASVCTILLITVYSFSFLQKRKTSGLLALLLFIFYAYIFTITQQQDYALLLGSIGLFIIIAVLMYVSRKINWYGDKH